MSEVLWNVRLLDLEAGAAAERRAVTVEVCIAWTGFT